VHSDDSDILAVYAVTVVPVLSGYAPRRSKRRPRHGTHALPARKATTMSTTTPRTAVTARIAPQHVEQLRKLADERDTTVSRLINRAVADKLAAAHKDKAQPAR
jgi:hypothetical protein